MPGPRQKIKAKKPKSQPKALSLPLNATPDDSEFHDLINDIEGTEGWNKIVDVLCEFLRLPGEYRHLVSLKAYQLSVFRRPV